MSLTKASYSIITGAPVNILDFGAIPGADNTAAIVAAIASITDGVGTKVILCESIISTMIEINKENVTFTSNGEKLIFSQNMALVPMGNAGFDNYTMFWVNKPRVSFVNTVFDGNGFDPGNLGGAAFFYWGSAGGGYDASYGNVIDCTFLDLVQQSYPVGYTVCIGARNNATGMVVRNCKFIDASAAIQFNSLSAGIIDGCVSTITSAQRSTDPTHPTGYYADQSFGLDGAGKGSMIINCTVQRVGTGTPYSGTNIGCSQGCTDFVIANNKVIGLGGAGTAYFISGTYGTVTGNIADGRDEEVRAAWGMMRFEPYVGTDFPTNLVISNNVIKSPLAGGVVAYGYGMKFPSASMTVENNVFALGSSNRVYAAMQVYQEDTILGTPTVIQNNSITGPSRGIHFEITDNGGYPIILDGNSYFGSLTEAYTADVGIVPPVDITYNNDVYGPNITSLPATSNWNSWTPSLGGNTTYTTQIGRYTRIGNMVTVWAQLNINAIGTGDKRIVSGLPFTSANLTVEGTGSVGYSVNLATAVVSLVPQVDANTKTISFMNRTGAANGTIAVDLFQNSARMYFTVSYMAA